MRAPRHPHPPEADVRLRATVTVRWCETVLLHREIAPGDTIVGAAPGSLLPIPCDVLGAPTATVATLRGRAPIAFVPARAIAFHERPGQIPRPVTGPAEIPLGAGETVSHAIEKFMIVVAASPAHEMQWAGISRPRALPAPAAPVALAALVHAIALVLSAQSARAASVEQEAPPTEELSRYLAAAEARSSAHEQREKGGEGTGKGKKVDVQDGNGKANGGARAAGQEGKMGSAAERPGTNGRYAIAGADTAQTALSRADALADARSFGMIGVLAADASHAPSASFGEVAANAQDVFNALGSMWSSSIAETFGAGGLALSGTGEGGGGNGTGVGLGFIGIGHGLGLGSGTGGLGTDFGWSGSTWQPGRYGPICYGGCSPRSPRAVVKLGMPSFVSLGSAGSVPSSVTEVIQRVAMAAREPLRQCYAKATRWASPLGDITAGGSVTTRFVVHDTGRVASAVNSGTTLPSPDAVSCVTGVFRGLSFPALPDGEAVGVVYPVQFWWAGR